MPTKGYDVFFPDPGAYTEMRCRACGSVCDVQRDVSGPTAFAEGLATVARRHDLFLCPYSDVAWHAQALELAQRIGKSPSPRLAALMRKDRDDLLRRHGRSPLPMAD